MTFQFRKAVCGFVIPALMAASFPASGLGAVIPRDIDHAAGASAGLSAADASPLAAEPALMRAGLSGAEAEARASTLDRAETAQLQTADLHEKGGDATVVAVLAIIGAVVVVIWLLRGMRASV